VRRLPRPGPRPAGPGWLPARAWPRPGPAWDRHGGREPRGTVRRPRPPPPEGRGRRRRPGALAGGGRGRPIGAPRSSWWSCYRTSEGGCEGPESRNRRGRRPALGRLLDDLAAERLGHGRRAVTGPQLLEDVLEVSLHRVGGDEELLGDVLVGVSERQQLEHLQLPGRQA